MRSASGGYWRLLWGCNSAGECLFCKQDVAGSTRPAPPNYERGSEHAVLKQYIEQQERPE